MNNEPDRRKLRKADAELLVFSASQGLFDSDRKLTRHTLLATGHVILQTADGVELKEAIKTVWPGMQLRETEHVVLTGNAVTGTFENPAITASMARILESIHYKLGVLEHNSPRRLDCIHSLGIKTELSRQDDETIRLAVEEALATYSFDKEGAIGMVMKAVGEIAHPVEITGDLKVEMRKAIEQGMTAAAYNDEVLTGAKDSRVAGDMIATELEKLLQKRAQEAQRGK